MAKEKARKELSSKQILDGLHTVKAIDAAIGYYSNLLYLDLSSEDKKYEIGRLTYICSLLENLTTDLSHYEKLQNEGTNIIVLYSVYLAHLHKDDEEKYGNFFRRAKEGMAGFSEDKRRRFISGIEKTAEGVPEVNAYLPTLMEVIG